MRLESLEDRTTPAVHTWTHGGATPNWSDPDNWDTNGIPTTAEPGGTIVVFGTSDTTPVMDIVGLAVDQIRFESDGNQITLAEPLTLSSNLLSPNILNVIGTNTIASSTPDVLLTLQGADAVVQVTAGTLDITSIVDSVGDLGVRKTGAGTLRYSPVGDGVDFFGNLYTGTTTVVEGVLELNDPTEGNVALAGPLVVGDGTGAAQSAIVRCLRPFQTPLLSAVLADGLFDANGFDQSIDSVSLSGGTIRSIAGDLFVNGDVIVTANPTPGDASEIEGSVLINTAGGRFDVAAGGALSVTATLGNGSGAGGTVTATLTKDGAGMLVLNGVNTYTGMTTVNAGTLAVHDDQPASAVVLAGGILGGTGTVGPITGGSATIAPGLFTPAATPTGLRSGSVTLNGTTLAPVLNTAGGILVDVLNVTGTANVTGAILAPTLTGPAPAIGQVFTIISNDGTDPIVGTFNGLPEGATVSVGGQNLQISYVGGDGNDVTLTRPTAVVVVAGNPRLAASGATNGSALVFVPDAGGQYPGNPSATLSPFGSIPGNVRSTTGDVNGDQVPDTILMTGPGTPIRFAVVSGADNTTLLVPPTAPFAGSEDFTGGGFLASADLDNDGRSEIVVTPDQGGGPRVTIFSLLATGLTLRANFFGIDDPNFRGGARPALGDVNHDGTPDLAVSAGFLGGPRTALFNGTTLLGGPTRLVGDFFAFGGEDATRLRNGVFVSIGDINGDGFADLIFGGGPGGAPRVYILSGELVTANNVAGAQASPVANFFVANNSTDRGGVRVAVKNADGDTRQDLVVGSGEGSPANVRVYLGKDFTGASEPASFQDISVFGGAPLPGGVFVG